MVFLQMVYKVDRSELRLAEVDDFISNIKVLVELISVGNNSV